MLKIHYVNGSIDNEFDINPAITSGSIGEYQTAVSGFVAGRLATVGTDGYVRIAVEGEAFGVGFIVNDAAGYSYENIPALASGKLPLMIGGGLATTDQVVEGTIKAGDKLYVVDGGLLSKVAPSADATPFGLARSANSPTDKSVKVYF